MLKEKGRPNWSSVADLNLSDSLEREWSSYTTSLVAAGIFLDRDPDRIVWNCNKQNRSIIAYQMYCDLVSQQVPIPLESLLNSLLEWTNAIKDEMLRMALLKPENTYMGRIAEAWIHRNRLVFFMLIKP